MTAQIRLVNIHLELLEQDVRKLVQLRPELRGKEEQELLEYIVDLFDKCDAESPNYNYGIDQKTTRICLETDNFNTCRSDRFCDDTGIPANNAGGGDTPGDGYDKYIDLENDRGPHR